jgi:hypothetical protein
MISPQTFFQTWAERNWDIVAKTEDMNFSWTWTIQNVTAQRRSPEFCSAQDILSSLSDAWSDLTFEDIQRVFLEWMDRLTWVLENDG